MYICKVKHNYLSKLRNTNFNLAEECQDIDKTNKIIKLIKKSIKIINSFVLVSIHILKIFINLFYLLDEIYFIFFFKYLQKVF